MEMTDLDLAGALHDPANLLARVGVTGPVHLTMVGGQVVFADGQLRGIDERAVAERAEQVVDQVIRRGSRAYSS